MESPFCPADTIKGDADFRLIETFLYQPGPGPRDPNRHLARMERSAAAFGIAFDRIEQETRLQALKAKADMRCRLTLARDGTVELVTAPFATATRNWVVSLAKQRVNSDDPWLLHKTTCRRLYDEARATLRQGVDEVLFLNERDEVCEGTITNLFVTLRSGRRVTPPLSSGLLPGVLRQRLLDNGRVVEEVVTVRDLRHARKITVGNSLRGEISAEYLAP